MTPEEWADRIVGRAGERTFNADLQASAILWAFSFSRRRTFTSRTL
jgi:hypothetical protein